MPSRRAILAAPAMLSMPTLTRSSWAQEAFPTRPIAIASGYAPGGVTDVTSRAVGIWAP